MQGWTSPDSDQLALALFDKRVTIPWEGRSPRDLTRARMTLFSSQEAQKSMSEFVDPAQCEFGFLTEKGPRRVSPRAPLLVPLKRSVYRG